LQPSKIIEKPWGQEEIWADCDSYLGKIITVNPGCRLSRQYHAHKEETIRVLSGVLLLEVGADETLKSTVLTEGGCFHVTPGTIHRFCCAGDESLILLEVSTRYPDDVIRLEDDYRR
jgi:mannose-6-phosphate isomerase-like protein (cupin superfamily)